MTIFICLSKALTLPNNFLLFLKAIRTQLFALTDFVSREKGPTLKFSSCFLANCYASINSYNLFDCRQKMTKQMEEALTMALRNLITEVSRNTQLSNFSETLFRRKQYDQCEKEYVEDQRLRKQLGNEYESSDSEEEKENYFNKMSQHELRKFMRKNLVDKHFDEDVLLPIQDPQEHENEGDELATVKYIGEDASSHQIRATQLNIIQEAKEIVEDELEKQTNFGLEFLIRELERIDRVGLSSTTKA